MLASLYAKFRGSTWFLLTLCLLIGASLFAHRFYGFDPGFGMTNLCLSIEASVSVALLIMDSERQQKAEGRRQEQMVDLMEAQAASMDALKEILANGKQNGEI